MKFQLAPCDPKRRVCPLDYKDRIQRLAGILGGYLEMNIVYQNTDIYYEKAYSPYYIYPDKSFFRIMPY